MTDSAPQMAMRQQSGVLSSSNIDALKRGQKFTIPTISRDASDEYKQENSESVWFFCNAFEYTGLAARKCMTVRESYNAFKAHMHAADPANKHTPSYKDYMREIKDYLGKQTRCGFVEANGGTRLDGLELKAEFSEFGEARTK